jgi:starvation-inducible outer membrane lipoprotein
MNKLFLVTLLVLLSGCATTPMTQEEAARNNEMQTLINSMAITNLQLQNLNKP